MCQTYQENLSHVTFSTVAHKCKTQQHILETQQTIFGTQHNFIETQHNIWGNTTQNILEIYAELCYYTTYKPFITLPLTCSAPSGNIYALEYDELFYMYLPENSGFEDFKCPITQQQLDNMAVCCATVEDENLFLEYFSYVLESLNLHHPTDWREAI